MNWIIVGVTGAAAFFLALLTGVISGVSFGVVFIRSILSGALFAGAAAGIYILLQNMIPELFEFSDNSDEGVEGSGIDIVVEGDDEEHISYSNDEPSEMGTLDVAADAADDVGVLESAEESGDGSEPMEGDGSPENSGVGLNFNMDELPEMDDFSDSFSGVADSISDESGGKSAVAPSSPSSQTTVDVLGDEQDPETIARAVQTVLKKDREG